MKIKILFSIIFLYFVLILTSCKDATHESTPPGPVWLTFTNQNTPALINHNIHTISRGADGRIWLGTDSGAVSYLNNSWNLVSDPFQCWKYGHAGRVENKKITAIAKGNKSSLWFGLDGCGLRRYNPFGHQNAWQTFFPQEFIRSIAADNVYYGDAWVVSTLGTYWIKPLGTDKDTIVSFYSPPLQSNTVWCVTFNPVNRWFFFGTNDGLVFFNDKDEWVTHPLSGPNKSQVKAIAVEYSNTVWLGKVFGLTSFNPTTNVEKHYPEFYDILSLTTDFYSVRWIGTSTGLYQLKDSIKTPFTTSNTPALPSNKIQSLFYDNKGNLWIGTDKGVAVYNENGTRL